MEKRVFATTYLVKVGLLAALSYMLMYLDDIFLPLTRLIFPEFLKLDFADVPALIGGFALGPLADTLVATDPQYHLFPHQELHRRGGLGGQFCHRRLPGHSRQPDIPEAAHQKKAP